MKSLLLLVALIPVLALGQAKTSFGSDNATRCYQESNAPMSDFGLRFCNEAIKQDNLMPRDRAATFTNRGIILAANGRYDEAMQDYERAMKITTSMGKIYINRGNVYHHWQDYDLALADYDKALALNDVPADIALYNKALTYIRLKQWDDAEASLKQALEINPESRRVAKKLAEFHRVEDTDHSE